MEVFGLSLGSGSLAEGGEYGRGRGRGIHRHRGGGREWQVKQPWLMCMPANHESSQLKQPDPLLLDQCCLGRGGDRTNSPELPSGMEIVQICIWTRSSHGDWQEELGAFFELHKSGCLSAFSLIFLLPPALVLSRRLFCCPHRSINNRATMPSLLPLSHPFLSSPPPASLTHSPASLWPEHFVCKVLSDATLRGAVNQSTGASPSLRR